MIIASIVMPNWVTYSVTTVKGDKIQKQIGLHRTCSTLADPTCQEFPSRDLCQEGERYFCSLWRTAGFMTSFAAILCLATLVAFAVTLGGGKYKRETGWPFISGLMSLVTVVELAVISMVVRLTVYSDVDGDLLTVSRLICMITMASLQSLDGILTLLGIWLWSVRLLVS